MQTAKVIGRATATIKHPTLNGWRLLVIQPLALDGGPDGEPQLAVDFLGSSVGSIVIAAADGSASKEIMGVNNTPARWIITGIYDQQEPENLAPTGQPESAPEPEPAPAPKSRRKRTAKKKS